jgi:hypothetical protein
MLYHIADGTPQPDRNGRISSDHVRVMAIGLIKDCYKEKMEILTSQAAVNHALDFIEKTNQQIRNKFTQDMERVVEEDQVESAAINDAIQNNEAIQSVTSAALSAEY